jgi:hypothetical protein
VRIIGAPSRHVDLLHGKHSERSPLRHRCHHEFGGTGNADLALPASFNVMPVGSD